MDNEFKIDADFKELVCEQDKMKKNPPKYNYITLNDVVDFYLNGPTEDAEFEVVEPVILPEPIVFKIEI